MDFCRTIFHEVQQGDSFYRLAQRYRTTVPDIAMRNPGVNPYNLQVGSRLRICPGSPVGGMRPEEMDLNNDMRQAWGQHNMWDAMFVTSLVHGLESRDDLEQKLLQSPEEIAVIFEKFYAQPTVNQLRQLLMEHVRLAGEMTEAMNAQNTERASQLEMQMNQNADQIARLLAGVNSRYDYEELRRMLRMHLNLRKNAVTSEMNGTHQETIRLIEENQKHMMELADVLTEGLLEQFYQR